MLDNFDRVFPFGLAKSLMGTTGDGSKIFVWDKNSKSFTPVVLPKSLAPPFTPQPIAPLKQLVRTVDQSSDQTKMFWQSDGSLTLKSKNQKTRPSIVLDCPTLPCFDVDCLAVQIDWQRDLRTTQPQTASLLFINDLQKEFDPAFRIDCEPSDTSGSQTLTFPLHSEVSWAMGGMCQQLKLLLPGGTCTIKSIAIEPLALTEPMLSLQNADNQYNLGYVQLNRKYATCKVDYDISLMPGASAAGIEVTRPNTFFQLHNSAKADPNALLAKTTDSKKGGIFLNLEDFPSSGIYEARVRALDIKGKPFGFASDHIVITVNH